MAPTRTVTTPDGRALDVWLAGPPDGQPVLFDDVAFTRPWGIDLGSVPGRVCVWQGGHDRMVPFAHGHWLAANVGGACPHLSPEGGHLSLVVERFGAILDELIAGAA